VYIRLQVEKAIMKRTGKEEADYRDLSEILWIMKIFLASL
jgi:hypothetical protein